MDKAFFESSMMKIINQFGSKSYSQDRITLIYNSMKNLSNNDFEKVVNHFVANGRNAPVLADFKTAIEDLGLILNRNESAPVRNIISTNVIYNLEGNYWASDKYVFNRGDKPSFVIKQDEPNHPMVKLDKELGKEKKLTQVKKDFEELNKRFKNLYTEMEYINNFIKDGLSWK